MGIIVWSTCHYVKGRSVLQTCKSTTVQRWIEMMCMSVYGVWVYVSMYEGVYECGCGCVWAWMYLTAWCTSSGNSSPLGKRWCKKGLFLNVVMYVLRWHVATIHTKSALDTYSLFQSPFWFISLWIWFILDNSAGHYLHPSFRSHSNMRVCQSWASEWMLQDKMYA